MAPPIVQTGPRKSLVGIEEKVSRNLLYTRDGNVLFQNGRLKKQSFSKTSILKKKLWKFPGLVLGLVELIDAKGIDVAQPIWLRDCPM